MIDQVLLINLDPMTPHFRSGFLAILVKHNQVGFLKRHVALGAIGRRLMTLFGKHGGFGFVTAQALLRECGEIVHHGVNIVTSETGHCRLFKAAASLQHFDLAAMHIQRRGGVRLGQC